MSASRGIAAKKIRRVVQPPSRPASPATSLIDPVDSQPPRWGWIVVARKELADHLRGARALVLFIALALAAAIPLYFASTRIRDAAPAATGAPAVFLALFTLGSTDFPILRVNAFVGIVAPLLGIAFVPGRVPTLRSMWQGGAAVSAGGGFFASAYARLAALLVLAAALAGSAAIGFRHW